MITVTYHVHDYSDGYRRYDRTISVPNYKTLRSLLSAVDATCLDIEHFYRDRKDEYDGNTEL